eukprot:TRINITY_DN35813_c0_g1_i1.p1 TRINITY_DN35813_c0_g1~~TRINITY_DN35813_c0_g1_i1.p1  ORF type:complete len:216 (-),score=65.74 TRINITY_DN35813_c0_g1_i1:61-708(-)
MDQLEETNENIENNEENNTQEDSNKEEEEKLEELIENNNNNEEKQEEKNEDDDDISAVNIEQLQKEMEQIEKEAERLQKIQLQVSKISSSGNAPPSAETQKSIDSRSVYVSNVDYGCTDEELGAHFKSCGTITRITIIKDKYTGHPKGYAYIEFENEDAVKYALILNGSLIRGRQLKVLAKRTNIPGMSARGRYRGRYRGYRRPRRPSYYYHPYQ